MVTRYVQFAFFVALPVWISINVQCALDPGAIVIATEALSPAWISVHAVWVTCTRSAAHPAHTAMRYCAVSSPSEPPSPAAPRRLSCANMERNMLKPCQKAARNVQFRGCERASGRWQSVATAPEPSWPRPLGLDRAEVSRRPPVRRLISPTICTPHHCFPLCSSLCY